MLLEAREQIHLGQGSFGAGSGKGETFPKLFICLCSKVTPWEPEECEETATPGDGNGAACAMKVQITLGNQPQPPQGFSRALFMWNVTLIKETSLVLICFSNSLSS